MYSKWQCCTRLWAGRHVSLPLFFLYFMLKRTSQQSYLKKKPKWRLPDRRQSAILKHMQHVASRSAAERCEVTGPHSWQRGKHGSEVKTLNLSADLALKLQCGRFSAIRRWRIVLQAPSVMAMIEASHSLSSVMLPKLHRADTGSDPYSDGSPTWLEYCNYFLVKL